ncbi:MAG: hypothetical protein NZ534_07585, partial [Bacteroidia bacterium]|nr:hypothetical protein [Bacteroidia bacterium]
MRVAIVALDNPYPPDYGGAEEIFARIRAFARVGWEVDLTFFHKPERAAVSHELTRWCRSVRGVPRKTGWRVALSALPYPVAGRRARVDCDGLPLIVEGVHCSRVEGPRAKTILRVHNVESEYYRELAERETVLWKRVHYAVESRKLRRYEPRAWAAADVLACVSCDEARDLRAAGYDARWLPPFAELRFYPPVETRNLLFYGNMALAENRLSALRAARLQLPDGWTLTLAGRGASRLSVPAKVLCVERPSDLEPLIARAAALVFPQTQRSGLKMKVWRALATDKPIFVTPEALQGTGLDFDPEKGIFPFDGDLGDRLADLRPRYERPDVHRLVSGN